MALEMAAVSGLLATMVSSIIAVAMAALVSMVLFFVVLAVFEDAPDCSGTTVVFAMEPLDVMLPFVFRFDFIILYNVESLVVIVVAAVDFCCCVLFVVAFDDVVAG